MKRLLWLFIWLPLLSFGQDYQPKPLQGEVVSHTYFQLSYVEAHEQPEWVYYQLSPEMINGSVTRTDDFRSDPLVRTVSASLEDYVGTGYDRGHLAPAADMKVSKTAVSESFYLSNMSPQAPSFNRGAWKKLETLVRSWALDEGGIYVVTGPIFSDNLGKIGPNEVTIPGYYYKVLYAEKSKKMIGLVLPNTKIDSKLTAFVRPVDLIEVETGLDFFYQLDDALENQLEANTSASGWDFGSKTKPSTTQTTSAIENIRCIAKTSSGKKCSRNSKDNSSYCWQHD